MDIQALDDTERAETELVPEDGEEAGEEGGRPADLGHNEDNDLEDDQEPVENGPEGTRGLVGDRASAVRGWVSATRYVRIKGDILDVVGVGAYAVDVRAVALSDAYVRVRLAGGDECVD